MNGRRGAVSIIVPTFNRARYLAATLDSLLAQSEPAAEIIVIDDGSTDLTANVLAPYRKRIACLEQPNRGKSAALNRGLAQASGDYIWVFDDDDVACPDTLARHLAVLERRPQVGFTISGSYRCYDDARGALVIGRAQPVRPFADDEYLFELLLSSYVAGPSSIIRRTLLDRVGGFREDLERAEDFEMALRLGLVCQPGRLDDSRPTYYRRWHRGMRGHAGHQFAYADNTRRSRVAERLVLRDLAPNLPLNRYLPRTQWDVPQDELGQCRAHLRRWIVAMQKGLWPEAHAELAVLCDLAPVLARLPPVDLVWAGRAFADSNMLQELATDPDTLRQITNTLKSARTARLRSAGVRQMYYHVRAALGRREPARVLFMIKMWRALFGAAATFAAVVAH